MNSFLIGSCSIGSSLSGSCSISSLVSNSCSTGSFSSDSSWDSSVFSGSPVSTRRIFGSSSNLTTCVYGEDTMSSERQGGSGR